MIYVQGNKLRDKHNYHSQKQLSKERFHFFKNASIFHFHIPRGDFWRHFRQDVRILKIKLGVQSSIFPDFKYKFKYENGLQMH